MNLLGLAAITIDDFSHCDISSPNWQNSTKIGLYLASNILHNCAKRRDRSVKTLEDNDVDTMKFLATGKDFRFFLDLNR